jgi:hypothetical protein
LDNFCLIRPSPRTSARVIFIRCGILCGSCTSYSLLYHQTRKSLSAWTSLVFIGSSLVVLQSSDQKSEDAPALPLVKTLTRIGQMALDVYAEAAHHICLIIPPLHANPVTSHTMQDACFLRSNPPRLLASCALYVVCARTDRIRILMYESNLSVCATVYTFKFSSDNFHKAEENHDLDVYVNISEMLDTFSKEMIYKKMPPPYSQTLFVELIRFTPGQPEVAPTNGATARAPSSLHSSPRSHSSHPISSRHPLLHHGSPPIHIPMEVFPDPAHPNHIPPPPPWSRWGTMSTPGRPPSTHRRQSTSARSTPQPPASSKKRKHVDDMSATEGLSRVSSSSSISAGPASKRRAVPVPHPSQINDVSSPPRLMQSISPSIAKLLAPESLMTVTEEMTDNWPRPRPSLGNGTSTGKSPLIQASGIP